MSFSPIKVFITGAANGLAEVREGLADHPEVELVGTAADPGKAGAKLAERGAQVILHGTTASDHVPTGEIEAIRGITAAPIVLVTSASTNSILSEALTSGVFDVVLLPQLTDGIVFTIKKANSLAAGRAARRDGEGGALRSTARSSPCSGPRADRARRCWRRTWHACSPAIRAAARCCWISISSSATPPS